MKYEYELNLKLFEMCVVMSNSRRWSDIYEQQEILMLWKDKVPEIGFLLMSYGLEIMLNGREPEVLKFLIDDFEDKLITQYHLEYNERKDLRLLTNAIKWIHVGEGAKLEELLLSLDDSELKSKYKYWIYYNQFDLKLDFETFVTMSYEELDKLKEGKQYIVDACM